MNEHLAAFVGYLTDKEKSKSTIESYTRYVKNFEICGWKWDNKGAGYTVQGAIGAWRLCVFHD